MALFHKDVNERLAKHIEELGDKFLPENWFWHQDKVRELKEVDEELIRDLGKMYESHKDVPEKFEKLKDLLQQLHKDLEAMLLEERPSAEMQYKDAQTVDYLIYCIESLILPETERRYTRRQLPRDLTNNELPEQFYEEEKGISPFPSLFAKLELVGITKYNQMMADILRKKAGFTHVALYPYNENYDGKSLVKEDPFPEYSIEERAKLLEADKDLTRFGLLVIECVQRLRLRHQKNPKRWEDIGIKLTRNIMMDKGLRNYLSDDLVKEGWDVYGKNAEFIERRVSEKGEYPIDKDTMKQLFPTKEISDKKWNETVEKTLHFGREVIKQVQQKMKEKYKAQK